MSRHRQVHRFFASLRMTKLSYEIITTGPEKESV